MTKNQCYFFHGADAYRSQKALEAIKKRFLAKSDSLPDLIHYDMEETSLQTLKQTMLTVPFFVSHRLFILKHTFSAPKATLEGVVALLDQISPATVVVFYESKPADKRFSLYQWLARHATVQVSELPTGTVLTEWISALVEERAIGIDMPAARMLADYYGQDTFRLAQEVQKLAQFVLAQKRTRITKSDVAELCAPESDSALFRLTDALREPDIVPSIRLYRHFITREEPMLLIATLASQIRTLAKLFLCYQAQIISPDAMVRASKLNPYVVKLALPLAKRLRRSTLLAAYRDLIWIDSGIKDGTVPPELGVLLLIIRLHDNLKRA